MKTSESGRKLIAEHEGIKLSAYKCSAGVWTIGFGHTNGVTKDTRCTIEQAHEWLSDDLADAELAVRNLVKVPLNQNQFDALVSFTFNLGAGALSRSTLLKHLNAGNYSAAAGQFKLWNMAGGKPVLGLTRRRAAEADLFNKPV